jgi:hypothetical protein
MSSETQDLVRRAERLHDDLAEDRAYLAAQWEAVDEILDRRATLAELEDREESLSEALRYLVLSVFPAVTIAAWIYGWGVRWIGILAACVLAIEVVSLFFDFQARRRFRARISEVRSELEAMEAELRHKAARW